MKTPRLIICHALLLALLPLGSAAFGQYEQPYMPYEDMGHCEACDSGYCGECEGHGKRHGKGKGHKGLWPSLPFGMPDSHIWVGYTYGNRDSSGIPQSGRRTTSIPSANASVSFDGGYSTVGGFFPHYTQFPNGNWFVQAHWHYTDQDQNMANIGLGRRFMLDDRMYGMSFWYDFDEAGDDNLTVGKPFHQIGLNFETRGPWFDMFINWYQPVGDRTYFTGSLDGGSAFFDKNILIQSGLDLAMEGMDAEVQMAVPFMEFLDPHASFGGYAYQDQTNDRQLNGYFGRFTFNPTPRTSFNVRINHDDTNNTTVAAQFAFGFGTSRRFACGSQLLDLPVRRLDHIVRWKQDQVVATNPKTGLPWQVQHVDNTALPGGDGSFETPYNELDLINGAGSEENDLIFVAVGTGTNLNYDAEVVLKDCQLFLGQGTQHFIETVEQGNFELPGFISGPNGERLAPMITATGGTAVTLANMNRVSGFDIDGANFGIVGDEVADFDINNNRFGANTPINNDAINIQDPSGTSSIEENEITNSANGIVLRDNGTATELNATIAANLIDGLPNDAMNVTVSDDDVWNLAVNGNDFINNENGLVANVATTNVAPQSTNLTITSTGNNYLGNADAGVRVNLDGRVAGLRATFNSTGDAIDENGDFGVDLQLANTNVATMVANFDGGQIIDTGSTTQSGIGINADVLQGLLELNAESLDIIGTDQSSLGGLANAQGALNINVSGTGRFDGMISDGSNITTTTGGSGVFLGSQGSSANSLTITDSNLNTNVNGLSVAAATSTTVSVNGGQLNNNSTLAVDYRSSTPNGTAASLTVQAADVRNNGGGIQFNSTGSAVTNAAPTVDSLTIDGVTFANNATNDIAIGASGASGAFVNATILNNVVNSVQNGLVVNTSGTGRAGVTVSDNTFQGGGGSGMILTSTGTSKIWATLAGTTNSFSGYTGDGIQATETNANGSGTGIALNITTTTTTFAGNATSGINLTSNGDELFAWIGQRNNVTAQTITGSANGIIATSNATGDMNLRLNGNSSDLANGVGGPAYALTNNSVFTYDTANSANNTAIGGGVDPLQANIVGGATDLGSISTEFNLLNGNGQIGNANDTTAAGFTVPNP